MLEASDIVTSYNIIIMCFPNRLKHQAVKDFALSDRLSKYRHFIQDKIL